MSGILAINLLALPVIITGLVALYLKVKATQLRLILAFSAAYLFAISIIHMLPEAFEQTGAMKQTGLFIVVGFCLQLLIDSFSTGIEHGHVHLHSHECKTRLPYGIIVGLFLHSFLEGLPVYRIGPGGSHVNHQLLLGLAIHNIPITLAFIALLKEHGSKLSRSILLLLSFSLMSPLGFTASYFLHSFGLGNYSTYSNIAYALVIGIFLHISTAILFESSEHHRYNFAKVAVMVLGIIFAYLLS